ncbi:alpha-amylase family glycosyl hydrolase [uncultured Lutibacter sp.]|uniref:alpha-amylase family glycosyl hydrolase n=1 Tax=uncultured Lutibacter sp. TaxID=437739 RepID=UPI00261816EE|nr:alpha-amylase family glycosyl hydrolase [uncultured Lutibacter sp.]
MKKQLLLVVSFLLLTNITFADSGIFESYIILNNGSNQYYDAQATTGNLDFNGANLGNFTYGSSYILNGGEVKTYKNGLSNVTGAFLYYRIYETGSTPTSSFNGINLPFDSDLGGGDQKWSNTAANINILNGLIPGDYSIEIYLQATSSDGDHYSNNGGSNYKATFKVTNETVLNGIVTVSPAIPTRSEQVTITLDATGTALETATEIYFHSGVGTDIPDSNQFSKAVGNWGLDDGIGEMTQQGTTNSWSITLSSIETYYALIANDDAFALNFLFRNGDGSEKEDNNGANYHLVLNPENYFLITNPTYNPFLVETNQSFVISGEANTSANWTLKELDEFGTVINANINSSTIQNYTFNYSLSDFDIIHYYQLSVDFGTETKTKNFEVSAYTAVQNVTLPANVKKGINYNFPNANEVTFVLHTPTSTTFKYYDSGDCEGTTSTTTTASKNIVHLIGDFNNWETSSAYQLKKDGDYWWITIDTSTLSPVQNEYVFQYLVDGEIRIGDPYAEKISDPDDQYINSTVYPNLIAYPSNKTSGRASVLELNKTDYAWQLPTFDRTIPRNDLNIYELHFRDFTAEGTYKAATEKLDYIKELGINCIHVMPVSEFEGNNSWGYNPNYYFAADKAYGTANDLKEFIDEAHIRGIAVVNDLVLNHAFYSNPNAMLYWNNDLNRPADDNPWFNSEHKGIYDSAGHWGADWNHASEHTQAMVDEILDYWISEFKFDGFRFDFTKGFTQSDQDSNDPWASNYNICRIAILERMVNQMWTNYPNTYAIFEHLANDSEDAALANYGILLWSGAGPQYSWEEMAMGTSKQSFSTSIYSNRGFTYANYMSYMESHDEERIGYKVTTWGQNNDTSIKYLSNRLKLPAAFNMFLPGPRMVWQFGELGYDISIDQNGRTGDKPSAWELNYDTDADRQQIYNFYSHIFKFRNTFDLYQTVDYGNIESDADWTRYMSLNDNTNNSSGNPTEVIVIGNFDTATDNAITPGYSYTGDWFKYNGDPEVDGTKYTVSTINDQYILYINDPIYILSNADIIEPRITTSTATINANSACTYTISGTQYDYTEEAWVANTAPSAQKASDNGTITELYYNKINNIDTTGKPTSLDGVTLNVGDNVIEWAVADAFGNTNTCLQTLTVTSSAILPTVSLQEIAPIAKGTATTVSIENPNAQYTYNWYLSETDTNPVSGDSFTTGTLNTSTDYWVEAVETATSCSSGKIKFTVSVSTTLALGDYEYLNEITSYPNPTKGTINIIIPNLINEVPVIIANIQGQIISQKTYIVRNGGIKIDISKNTTGIYFIKLLLEKPKILKTIKY